MMLLKKLLTLLDRSANQMRNAVSLHHTLEKWGIILLVKTPSVTLKNQSILMKCMINLTKVAGAKENGKREHAKVMMTALDRRRVKKKCAVHLMTWN